MSLRFAALASGSGGNASLVVADGFGVLIDAGLGPRQLAARLAAVGASWHDVHAVLLTHIHGDHWNERTLTYLCKRRIPLFCHPVHTRQLHQETSAFGDLRAQGLVRLYEVDEDVFLGSALRCRPVALPHDGDVTCGFRLEGTRDFLGHAWALGYAADLGSWTRSLAQALADVDILALEFNHDVGMELTSGRSRELIARVLGENGHLSNDQAAAMVREVLRLSEHGRVQHVVQLHLSRDCNRPRLARAAMESILSAFPHLRLHTAAQHRPGPRLRLGMSRFAQTATARSRAPLAAAGRGAQALFPDWD